MKDTLKFIPVLIILKKEMDFLVQNIFDNNILFQDTKNKAFCLIMKKKYIFYTIIKLYWFYDEKGIKELSENQIEDLLNDNIDLFKSLNSKLLFQLEENKKLSVRLINNKSLSLIVEQNFINKLQEKEGITYINKMNEMMKDLK